MTDEARKEKAYDILINNGFSNLEYLGQGFEGVVYTDRKWVYKVIVPFFEGKGDKWGTLNHLYFFMRESTELYKSFYKIEELIETKEGILIEKYPFEFSERVKNFSETDAIQVLTECWQKKVLILDCKKDNFIRVNGVIKLIDMDACTYYDDRLFLNVCARMYIFINYPEHPYLKKLQRSAINNFNLPELEGLREFVNKVFANIIFQESKAFIEKIAIKQNSSLIYEEYKVNKLPNLEKLFYLKLKENLYLSDIQLGEISLSEENTFVPGRILVGFKQIEECPSKISLLIKTCAMDVATIEQNIKHIVRQLSCPERFYEIVVSLDSKKNDFLRQYTDNSNYDQVKEILLRLQDEKVIDRIIFFDDSYAETVNKNWFNLATSQTHSSKNVPVASQLYAFEQCKGDYIFQMDSDVMVGRKDFDHNYIEDMISEIKKNPLVVSVGFNINNSECKPYFGFENGGFVPEVRMGLFDKERFFSLRPLPNELDENGRLKLTWYRSMEQHQKNTGFCSIRGGDNRSFFVHPQNYRKGKIYSWMNILDRVEQNQLPECQLNHFDCEGSFFDWCRPKRNEEMIVMSYFRNISPDRFLRFWCSLMNQSYQNFGLVLYDDDSNNGTSILIQKMIEPYKERITYIKGRNWLPKLQCEYLILHNICTNPESIIVCLDTDDALIGKDVLLDIHKKYAMWGVDCTCGRVHQTYRIQADYRYPVDFLNPRERGGNVWQHTKTFKKYLFTSIPLNYFLKENLSSKLSEQSWYEKCDDFAMMVPIVEMSKSPYQMDFINYYYERDYENRDADRELKNECIRSILSKKKLSPEDVVKGRIDFLPDMKCIEIDITFECNLNCKGCNRSCGKAPSKDRISVQTIRHFIQDSIKNNVKWKVINILGGEPTLHPEFLEILGIIQKEYADIYNTNVKIKVVSNGFTEKNRELCDKAEKLYHNVEIDRNSYKKNNSIDYFTAFNDAPCDDPQFKGADYSKACWVAEYCGIGLNKNGYYACSVCGGIDRLQGGKKGYSSLSELSKENIKSQYSEFCKLCGNFKYYDSNRGNFIPRAEKEPFRDIISPSWEILYKNYKEHRED